MLGADLPGPSGAGPSPPNESRPADIRNLWRMMPFHETYRGQPKRAPLVRE